MDSGETSRTLAVALSLAFGVGCAGPLTSPDHGGATWRALRSAHFILETDVSAAAAQERLVEFETLHAAIATVFAAPAGDDRQAPVEVVLLHDRDDFAALAGHGVGLGGYFVDTPPGDLEPQPTLVFPDSQVTSTQATFLHELTHRFVRQRYTDPPLWLNEGLAEYFSTLRVEPGRLVLGAPLPGSAFTSSATRSKEFVVQERQLGDGGSLLDRREDRESTFLQTQIPVATAPTAAQLLHADRDTFYAWSGAGTPSEEALNRQEAYYTAAWKLVHMLSTAASADVRERFQTFLRALASGKRQAAALTEAFGEDAAARMEADYRAYLVDPKWRTTTIPFTAQRSAPVSARELTDAEVHLLWARHRAWRQGPTKAARADVAEAIAKAPRSPDALRQRAVFEAADGRLDDALRDLDAALAVAPDDPRVLLARIKAQGRRDTRAKRDSTPPRELVDRLARTAKTATQLEIAAIGAMMTLGAAPALALADRAVAIDPQCWSCQHTRATMLLAAGRLDEALDASTRALAALPERARSRAYTDVHKLILAALARRAARSR